jgi:hypothetical protein
VHAGRERGAGRDHVVYEHDSCAAACGEAWRSRTPARKRRGRPRRAAARARRSWRNSRTPRARVPRTPGSAAARVRRDTCGSAVARAGAGSLRRVGTTAQ